MATIDEALTELKVLLATVDPSPQPSPAAVYIYPDDYASIDINNLPFVTVEQAVNEPVRWGVKASGKGIHVWEADIRIFLKIGQLINNADILDAATKQKPWMQATVDILFANMSLNGQADLIGGGRLAGNAFGDLLEYRIGHMTIGADTTVFWGIGMRLPIMQTYLQAMNA